MPYEIGNPPERIKKLPKHAQRIWIAAFNSAWEQYGHDEERANKVAWAAVKKVYRKNESGKWVKKKSSYSFPICFSDAKIEKEMTIHILPIGEWKHALYGDIKITETEIEEFVQHFDQGIRKGVTITEGHASAFGGELPAVGWFKKLINKKEKGLWGIVEWNDKGRELLEQKAYKYFSPEYCTVYEDPETHKLYNNVLTGGALTNSPYFKGLKAIVMSEPIILNQFKNMTEEIIEDSKEKEIEKDNEYAEDEISGEKNTELSDDVMKFAKWTRAFINDLPDSCFAYIESGGKKDKDGKTVPRSLRHLPYKDASGKIDLPHLRNAIARASRVKDKNGNPLPESIVKRIQNKLQAILAKSTGKKASDNVIDKLIYREPMKNLSEKLIYQIINSTGDVEMEDKTDLSEFKKELLRTGTWNHGAGKNGILEITKETLKSIVKNFKDKVLDNVFVPLGHPTTDDPSCNVGEVVDLSIEEGEKEDKLMATIDVKEKGIISKIKEGIIKCISASLTENYVKKDTGEDVGPVLFHAALVSEPYIKGMAPFVPLSENMQGSTIIPIMNMEEPLTLQDLSIKIENMAKEIKEIKLNETKEEESKEEETKTEVETETEKESSEVSGNTEKEEEKEVEVKTEEKETESEETNSEAEKVKESKETEETEEIKKSEESEETEDEGVALAEAERMFTILLSEGKVTPTEKDLLVPALTSNSIIELSDGKQISTRNQLFEYLKKQPCKFSLSEDGTIPDKKMSGKKVEMSEEANRAASKIAQALDLSEEEKLAMIKEVEEEKRNR